MLLTLVYFLLALLLLVSIHEYGHFQVARWCGVKVLRFSFGFGKVLFRWTDKKGTEYAWSLFPLGGYVKMLDETEEPVAEHEKHLAFNNKPVLARIAIVLAGPLFNLLFAFVALWLVSVIGMYSLAPIIEKVKPNSIAAQSGITADQEIISLNKTPINSWRDVQYALMPLVGSDEKVEVTLKSLKNDQVSQVMLPLTQWKLDEKKTDPILSLGIEPFIPRIPPIIGEVVADSPADKAGIKVGDKLLSINGKAFSDWMDFVDYTHAHPSEAITLELERNHEKHPVKLIILTQKDKGSTVGYVGVRSQKVNWPEHWLRLQRLDPLTAVASAFKQTLELTGTTFVLMGRLVTGKLALNTISGPVGIAQGAGDSGRGGFVAYLFFLAIVSISLGTLNLLPIPMLDGGHLLYYFIEIIRGKPLSDSAKSIGLYAGLLFIIGLMVVALTNDITRLFQ